MAILKRYLSQLKLPILMQIIFTILYSITVALFPVLNKYMFDNILQGGWNLAVKLIVIYLLLIILNSIFQYISRMYEWIVSKNFLLRLNEICLFT